MDNSQHKFPYSFSLAATLVATAMTLLFMYATQGVLIPLLFSILISITLYPITRFFESLRVGRATAAILSVIVAITVIWTIGWFIVHQSIIIGKDASAITEKVISVFERAQNWIEQSFGIQRTEMMNKLQEQGNKLLSNVGSMATATFGSIGNMLASAILVPLFSFFLLYYRV
ncbi:AI-2E family transporter, partial [Sphingobacterium shayense]|uniref:AI-2E family transporter n=1 Tax=Sphingobacterium shayense TaxID=626343 RepID=UPI001557F541